MDSLNLLILLVKEHFIYILVLKILMWLNWDGEELMEILLMFLKMGIWEKQVPIMMVDLIYDKI